MRAGRKHSCPAGEDQPLLDLDILMALEPIRRLSTESLTEIRRHAHVRELPAGSRLFVRGRDDHRVFYLLDGEVELSDEHSIVETVAAGTEASRQPLAPGQPRRLSGTARTRIRYLGLNAELLDVLAAPAGGETRLDEILPDEGSAENQVLYCVYQDYMADRLEVPSLPDLAIRIRGALQDPDVGLDHITRIVKADPSVVAHLVRVANSALYAGGGTVRDIRDAIVRLGVAATRDQVTAFTLRNMFKTRYTALKERMLQLWQHSCMVGAIAFVMARLIPRLNPDQALLAGLVHDIGAAALMGHVDRHPALLANHRELEEMIDRLRGQVGAMVLRKWGFADELVDVALEAENWQRDGSSELDLCDLIILAQLHSYVGTPQAALLPSIDSIPAIQKLKTHNFTPQRSLEVLESAKQEVAELHQSLMG